MQTQGHRRATAKFLELRLWRNATVNYQRNDVQFFILCSIRSNCVANSEIPAHLTKLVGALVDEFVNKPVMLLTFSGELEPTWQSGKFLANP